MKTNTPKYTIEDLKAAEQATRTARHREMEIRDAIEAAEWAPKRKALYGKCFKAKNNYSCPEKPSDYWWLWIRVTGETPEGCLTINHIQKDKHGKIDIRDETLYYTRDASLLDSYIPVTLSEYRKATRKILKDATKIVEGS